MPVSATLSDGHLWAAVEQWKRHSRYSTLLDLDEILSLPYYASRLALAALVEFVLGPHVSGSRLRRDLASSVGFQIKFVTTTLGAALTATDTYRDALTYPGLSGTGIGLLMHTATTSDAALLTEMCNHNNVWIRREAAANPACPDYARVVVVLRDPDGFPDVQANR